MRLFGFQYIRLSEILHGNSCGSSFMFEIVLQHCFDQLPLLHNSFVFGWSLANKWFSIFIIIFNHGHHASIKLTGFEGIFEKFSVLRILWIVFASRMFFMSKCTLTQRSYLFVKRILSGSTSDLFLYCVLIYFNQTLLHLTNLMNFIFCFLMPAQFSVWFTLMMFLISFCLICSISLASF